jgi:hypothetical protein
LRAAKKKKKIKISFFFERMRVAEGNDGGSIV